MYGGYLPYFVGYLALTAVLSWLTRKYYRIRWIDSAIAANGLMSSAVIASLLVAATFGIPLPYKLSPAALVSVGVVFFNNFKGNIAQFAQRMPEPVPAPQHEAGTQDEPFEGSD